MTAAPIDIDELRRACAEITPELWCRACIYSEVRHVARNCDVGCGEHSKLDNKGGFDRYAGEPLYDVVTQVPALLDELADARRVVAAARETIGLHTSPAMRRLETTLTEHDAARKAAG